MDWDKPISVVDFYQIASLVYLPVALVLSLCLSREKSSVPPKGVAKGRVAKQVSVKTSRRFCFPPGQVGYCTYCDRFLMEEEHAENHEKGKKHMENAAGAQAWLEFRAKSDAGQSESGEVAVPAKQLPSDGWQQVEAEKRRKKPKRQDK